MLNSGPSLGEIRRQVKSLQRRSAVPLAALRLQRIAEQICDEWSVAVADSKPIPDTQSIIQRITDRGLRLNTFGQLNRHSRLPVIPAKAGTQVLVSINYQPVIAMKTGRFHTNTRPPPHTSVIPTPRHPAKGLPSTRSGAGTQALVSINYQPVIAMKIVHFHTHTWPQAIGNSRETGNPASPRQ